MADALSRKKEEDGKDALTLLALISVPTLDFLEHIKDSYKNDLVIHKLMLEVPKGCLILNL